MQETCRKSKDGAKQAGCNKTARIPQYISSANLNPLTETRTIKLKAGFGLWISGGSQNGDSTNISVSNEVNTVQTLQRRVRDLGHQH